MAFTEVEVVLGSFISSPTATATLTNPVAAGDLLIAVPYFYTVTSNHLSSLSCSDSTNTGSYAFPSQAQIYGTGTNNSTTAVAWIKCNASGTPTVSMTATSNFDGWNLLIAHYTCSSNNPGFVSVDTTATSGTSASAAATGFTNSYANELTLSASVNPGNVYSSPTGGFTQRQSGGGYFFGDLITATSGNAINWGAAIGTSNGWASVLASFIDAPANSAAIAWVT
jgi:hypothetical protein